MRRSPLALTAVAVICGLAVAASSITLVRAADDVGIFGFFRSEYANRAARAVRYRPPVDRPFGAEPRASYASDSPTPPRKPVRRKAKVALASASARLGSTRTMCVRLCDGYTFPVGTLRRPADLPAHQTACRSACPGADTALYTLRPGQKLDEPGEARSVADGSLYRRLKTALLFRKEAVAACSCQGPDNIATPLPIHLDPTLRAGDAVVDSAGRAQVYGGNGALPHRRREFVEYRRSPVLTRVARHDIDRLIGTSHKAKLAREFNRSQRTREARLSESHFREVAAPTGSAAGVRVFQAVNAQTADASSARIIVIR